MASASHLRKLAMRSGGRAMPISMPPEPKRSSATDMASVDLLHGHDVHLHRPPEPEVHVDPATDNGMSSTHASVMRSTHGSQYPGSRCTASSMPAATAVSGAGREEALGDGW
uniref:Uncharacterized protein n=1 Tax=Oryza meridionalis TaxID=40149 RepID=A0A0E0DI08_9ORYZ